MAPSIGQFTIGKKETNKLRHDQKENYYKYILKYCYYYIATPKKPLWLLPLETFLLIFFSLALCSTRLSYRAPLNKEHARAAQSQDGQTDSNSLCIAIKIASQEIIRRKHFRVLCCRVQQLACMSQHAPIKGAMPIPICFLIVDYRMGAYTNRSQIITAP